MPEMPALPAGGMRPRRRLLGGVRPLPTLITLGNLLCGFGAIALSMRADNPPAGFYGFHAFDCLYWAGLLIFVAMIFDVLDGRVARWTKSTSRFGMEMDALADVVSFGVAPAVLVKAAIDYQSQQVGGYPLLDRYIWPLLATYVACAALRLARYNVESEKVHRDFFFGLPSPAAAGCAASLVVMITPAAQHLPQLQAQELTWLDAWCVQIGRPLLTVLPFVMLALGILMVSRVHYLHLGDRLLGGRRSLLHLLLLILALALIVMQHKVMLALLFNGYMAFGVLNDLRHQLFPATRPAEWVGSAEETAPAADDSPAAPPAPPPAPPGPPAAAGPE